MTAIDRAKIEALITEARETFLDPYEPIEYSPEQDYIAHLADALESLLALVPEPAEDEQSLIADAIWDVLRENAWESRFDSEELGNLDDDGVFRTFADAILARGFRLRALPTREWIIEVLTHSTPGIDGHGSAHAASLGWSEMKADAIIALLRGER